MSATSRSDASSSSPVDPITVAVVSNRLFGIVQEMGEAMLRTSYSQILNSSRDFSVALCDAKGRLIAQAEHIPIHVGAMPFALQSVLTAFGDDVHPGDIFLMNDPYHGGSHLPDLTAIIPVYDGERLAYWSLNRAHQSDIGGATHGAYNPAATEIWQEGFRVPPIRLGQNGKMRDDLVAMLAANVRHPRDFLGDLAAMIGSAQLGARRMASLINELGGVKLDAALEALLDASERQARAVISTWKDGVYKGEAFLDDDGRGNDDIAIRATVTKQGSELTVDLSESAPQVASFVNSSYANTCSAVVAAIAYLMDPDTPKNAGSSRPLRIIAKEGTIVWSRPGAPVTMCTSHCSNEIIEAVVRALAGACPERAMGGWGRRFRISIKGEDPRTGKDFIWHMFHARPGGGASSGGDGWHNAGEWHSAGGLKFGSVEVAEVRFPLHFRKHELRPGSGGDGQYRGGAGVDLDLEMRTATPSVGNTAGDGIRHGAAGMLGGSDGKPHHYVLHSKGKPDRTLKTKEVGVPLAPGDVLEVHSGGGGGWGPPGNRSAEARARDVVLGLIAVAPARGGRS
jgi:N-methylhydantoinase B